MSTPNFVGRYELGQSIKLRATVLGSGLETPAAPSVFMFLVKNPGGSVATYQFGQAGASIANPGVGAFFKDLSIPLNPSYAGTWIYRPVATGMVEASEEWGFYVNHSHIL